MKLGGDLKTCRSLCQPLYWLLNVLLEDICSDKHSLLSFVKQELRAEPTMSLFSECPMKRIEKRKHNVLDTVLIHLSAGYALWSQPLRAIAPFCSLLKKGKYVTFHKVFDCASPRAVMIHYLR